MNVNTINITRSAKMQPLFIAKKNCVTNIQKIKNVMANSAKICRLQIESLAVHNCAANIENLKTAMANSAKICRLQIESFPLRSYAANPEKQKAAIIQWKKEFSKSRHRIATRYNKQTLTFPSNLKCENWEKYLIHIQGLNLLASEEKLLIQSVITFSEQSLDDLILL